MAATVRKVPKTLLRTFPSSRTIFPMTNHISDHDLERYHLGMIADEGEFAPLEEHLLGCVGCAARAEEAAQYVDAIRTGIIRCNFDLAIDQHTHF